jgi:hypothetical protein
MPNELQNLRVGRVDFVDRAAVRDPQRKSEPRRFLLFKAEDGAPTPTQGEPVPTDTVTPEQALAKAQADLAAANEALEKAAKDTADEKKAREEAEAKVAAMKKAAGEPESEPEGIDKSELPEPVRKALEKAEADNTALTQRIEKAEADAKAADEIAKAERDRRELAEFVQKAETFQALPASAAELGPLLKNASEKLSKEDYEKLEGILKGADAQVAAGELFKEQGRSGGALAENSALSEFNKKVADLQKSESGLKKSEAMERVRKAEPELQARMAAEL